MNKDETLDLLEKSGYKIKTCDRMVNDKGWQIRCQDGEIVDLYDTGKAVAGGKNSKTMGDLLTGTPTNASSGVIAKGKAKDVRNVFVVYGHDTTSRTELEGMLRRWGLNPLILDQIPSGGMTIIEKLESIKETASYAVILSTPDDEGHRANVPTEKAFRARQNVVLELGMMLQLLGRDKVAILIKGQAKMERPSDIQGLIYIPFNETVAEAKLTLAKEINSKGITIDLEKV